MPPKRKDTTFAEKKALLVAYDALPKLSQRDAADRLQISQSALFSLLKNRDEILSNSCTTDRKRQRMGKEPVVEAAVVKWIAAVREKNANLSGPVVIEKAKELAQKLNKPDFKPTDGWFSRLKKREGIIQKKLHGEGQAADLPSRDEWMDNTWPELRARYSDENIWNADESGLYFRALPDSTLTFANDKRKGGKTSKDRITALFCCSMVGEKRKIFVIGKNKSPRCFKGVHLPVHYKANNSAWMTADFFETWLKNWDRELRHQRYAKILLLVDNCSAHPKTVELTHIELAFLPANTTSVLQPCDQGIIRALKAHYRQEICKTILFEMDNSPRATAADLAKKISLLDGIHKLTDAWEFVSPTTIRNCWCKSGLKWGPHERPDNVPLIVPVNVPLPQPIWEGWVLVDEDVPVVEAVTEDTIVAEVLASQPNDFKDEPDIPNDETSDDEAQELPSNRDMMEAMSTLRRGLRATSTFDLGLLRQFENAFQRTISGNLKQSTLDKFFVLK